MVAPDQIKWGPAPDVLPKGAQVAVIFGDPRKEGLFAFRLKLPAGYKVAPHTHPTIEAVTVISGTFKLGMGGTADPAKLEALPAGSFFAFPPGTPHFAGSGRGNGGPDQHRWTLGPHLREPEGRSAEDTVTFQGSSWPGLTRPCPRLNAEVGTSQGSLMPKNSKAIQETRRIMGPIAKMPHKPHEFLKKSRKSKLTTPKGRVRTGKSRD